MPPPTAAIVVSHYNAWPTDQLIALLDQMQSVPAGYPFSVRVVVNQAEDKRLELPERHADVAVYHRENTGYNIGAWEYGWRREPRADYYLFLQEESILVKPNWLRAFIRKVDRPKVGVVGEIIGFYNTTWDDINESAAKYGTDPNTIGFREHMTRQGIRYGELADHLQSLVLCLKRATLEAIGGFRIGISKYEAIAYEIGISKSVQAVGLTIRQVSLRPFTYIQHPQWEEDRLYAHKPSWMIRRILSDYLLLARLQRFRRARARRRRGGIPLSPAMASPPPTTPQESGR